MTDEEDIGTRHFRDVKTERPVPHRTGVMLVEKHHPVADHNLEARCPEPTDGDDVGIGVQSTAQRHRSLVSEHSTRHNITPSRSLISRIATPLLLRRRALTPPATELPPRPVACREWPQ